MRGRDNQYLHDEWRKARAKSTGYADTTHPFRHQGSAGLNSYKLFLEVTHALLRPSGRLGFVVPSGLYSDNGCGHGNDHSHSGARVKNGRLAGTHLCFWRVDREKAPELRHTVLTLIAFQDLQAHIASAGNQRLGIKAFLTQNAGAGWQLPETLRLADYGLGHDDRAQHP